jgi:hypothetical protein
MMESFEQPCGSNTVLVLDIDQLVTRVVLCDVVEGVARLINVAEAPTTSGSPYFDTSIGLHAAIHRLENESGRTLLGGDRLITPVSADGDGVDSVYITGLPVPPVKVGMVAMDAGDLGSMLAQAVYRSVSQLYDASEYVRWLDVQFTPSVLEGWLRDARPSTLLLVSQNEPIEEWRASLEIIAGVAPQFGSTQGIIVGNDSRQNVAAEVLDDVLELSGIDPASYDFDEIASAVEAELRDQYLATLQHEPALNAFADATFVDRLQALDNVAAFLHRRMGRDLALILGSQGTLIKLASQHRGITVYRADFDLGSQARSLLQLPPSVIGRWLPFQMTEDEIHHWLLNRTLRPEAMLDGENDLAVAAGVTRELLTAMRDRANLSAAKDLEFVVLGREWFEAIGPTTPLAILDGLDNLPPDGLIMLSLDRDNVASALGAIAAEEPDYAREVVESDFMASLASCIVFNGTGEFGEALAQVVVETDEGEQQELRLNLGDVVRFDLPEGRSAQVSIYPEGDFSVGQHPPGDPVRFDGERSVIGGEFGIIFDGRGRPVDLPIETEPRIASISGWAERLGTRVNV